ncbi:MAG: zinc dependent phospholipase C family protein [Proteobacteria bacterium]|nr:zinc dependent phospholipase C family protein [Pseudomonadota bacterium]
MAAAFWHLLIANRLVEELKGGNDSIPGAGCIERHWDCFAAGTLGPDLNFFPGGKGEVSDLAHLERPVDLGRALVAGASNDKEKAYALGWMMHIVTDLTTHELVNRLVAERRHPNQASDKTFIDDPLGHHRIEWGIDVFLAQDRELAARIPDLGTTLGSATDATGLVVKAYKEVFEYDLSPDTWQNALFGMIKYIGLFEFVWRLTGRIASPNRAVQLLKTVLYISVALPIARCATLRNPQNGVGGLIPILPIAADRPRIAHHTEESCHRFLKHLATDFGDLENRNLGG